MATRQQIIDEARSWIKTPWRHQGRLKGYACDCVGVMICAPRSLGVFPPGFDITGYPRNPKPDVMVAYLNQYLDPVPKSQKKGGDLLLLMPERTAQHVGLLTFDGTLIHAIDKMRGVREHVLDARWDHAICSVFRYRGLDD